MKSLRTELEAPDQRYWRRRQNRRVRKVRRTRMLLRWSAILTLQLAIAAVLVYSGIRILDGVAGSGRFALRTIEIEGALRAAEDSIRERLAPQLKRNLFELDLPRIEKDVRQDPWVLAVSIKRKLPGTLRVTVVERRPAALAVIGRVVHVIDPTGYVIGPAGVEIHEPLPVLSGLNDLDDRELVRALRRGAGLVRRLRAIDEEFVARIAEIDMSRSDRIRTSMTGPGPALLLDPRNAERNLRSYMELHSEIEDRVGQAEYVDLRWRDRIVVMPAVNTTTGGG